MLDFPAFALALWAAFDAGQIPRPEYLLPVLYTESGFQSVQNLAGAPYYGIGQTSGAYLESRGIDPQAFLAMPASQQLAQGVAPLMASNIREFGELNSGVETYLANFLPAFLKGSRSLSTVIATRGDGTSFYESNYGLDRAGKGTITIGDLAYRVQQAAAKPAVVAAIINTYEQRPGELQQDPTWGTSYPWQKYKGYVVPCALLVAGGALAHAALKGGH